MVSCLEAFLLHQNQIINDLNFFYAAHCSQFDKSPWVRMKCCNCESFVQFFFPNKCQSNFSCYLYYLQYPEEIASFIKFHIKAGTHIKTHSKKSCFVWKTIFDSYSKKKAIVLPFFSVFDEINAELNINCTQRGWLLPLNKKALLNDVRASKNTTGKLSVYSTKWKKKTDKTKWSNRKRDKNQIK